MIVEAVVVVLALAAAAVKPVAAAEDILGASVTAVVNTNSYISYPNTNGYMNAYFLNCMLYTYAVCCMLSWILNIPNSVIDHS